MAMRAGRSTTATIGRWSAGERTLITAAVRKNRALRKVRMDTLSGVAQEVDAKSFIDRGLGFELTDLDVGDQPYCSLAFEAFPNDSAISAAFTEVVEGA